MKRYIKEVDGFFDKEACQYLINHAEELGFEKATINTRDGKEVNNTIRNNDKVEFHDDLLENTLEGEFFDMDEIVNGFPGEDFIGVNNLFRIYRYSEGQEFKVHMDGTYEKSSTERSKITVLIYLNDEFGGGETEFVMPHRVVTPETGKLLLFTHKQLHRGNMVSDGLKYVLRTDLMYRKK
jgi:prolyl 4-hydroxylase